MTDREFLQSVRAIVEKGWTQDEFVSTHYRCTCLAGAAGYTACGVDPQPLKFVDMSKFNDGEVRLANLMGFINEVEIYSWNDEIGRTKEQVLAKIDLAIANLEKPA